MHKEWKELKTDIDEFVCQIDSLYKNCESVAEVDERAYARGLKDAKKEACKNCPVYEYVGFIQEFKKLPEVQQQSIRSLVYTLVHADDL